MKSYGEMFLNWYLISFFAAFTLAMNITLGGAVYLAVSESDFLSEAQVKNLHKCRKANKNEKNKS